VFDVGVYADNIFDKYAVTASRTTSSYNQVRTGVVERYYAYGVLTPRRVGTCAWQPRDGPFHLSVCFCPRAAGRGCRFHAAPMAALFQSAFRSRFPGARSA
jgi:hypothetical protein